MDYKHTCDTIYTHFQCITNYIYGFGRPFSYFFAPSFFTHPPIFLPVHIRFYPSKWRVDGSVHKAMTRNTNEVTHFFASWGTELNPLEVDVAEAGSRHSRGAVVVVLIYVDVEGRVDLHVAALGQWLQSRLDARVGQPLVKLWWPHRVVGYTLAVNGYSSLIIAVIIFHW